MLPSSMPSGDSRLGFGCPLTGRIVSAAKNPHTIPWISKRGTLTYCASLHNTVAQITAQSTANDLLTKTLRSKSGALMHRTSLHEHERLTESTTPRVSYDPPLSKSHERERVAESTTHRVLTHRVFHDDPPKSPLSVSSGTVVEDCGGGLWCDTLVRDVVRDVAGLEE